MEIKWMWNGIKVDGKLHGFSYSKGVLIGDMEETITLYAKEYSNHLPKIDGLNIENDSDSMTDYFTTDSIHIRKDSKFWNEAFSAYLKSEQHYEKQMDKRILKSQKLAA